MNRFQSVFLVSLLISRDSAESFHSSGDYCRIKCGSQEHTMCLYKGISTQCEDYINTYSNDNAADALNVHNSWRNALASGVLPNQTLPKASNMRLMVWDQELATIAHRWVSQCVLDHDTCRDTWGVHVGQNVHFLKGEEVEDEFDLVSVLLRWEDEIERMTEKDVSSFTMENFITNVSQMLWATTYKVGCSEVAYRKGAQNMKAIACNYAPRGNIEGESIYKSGEPCSACPRGTKCDIIREYKFLCGQEHDVNLDEDFDLIDLFGPVSGSHYALPLMLFELWLLMTIFA